MKSRSASDHSFNYSFWDFNVFYKFCGTIEDTSGCDKSAISSI
jgi:hypothetical protein